MAIITIKKFSRPGCMPCRVLSNYFTEIDLEAHNATLEEVDITEHPEAISDYDLKSVPVMVFLRSGVPVHRLVGLRPVEEILDAIEYAKVVR